MNSILARYLTHVFSCYYCIHVCTCIVYMYVRARSHYFMCLEERCGLYPFLLLNDGVFCCSNFRSRLPYRDLVLAAR